MPFLDDEQDQIGLEALLWLRLMEGANSARHNPAFGSWLTKSPQRLEIFLRVAAEFGHFGMRTPENPRARHGG